jgi:hypothetical protein
MSNEETGCRRNFCSEKLCNLYVLPGVRKIRKGHMVEK